MPRLLLLGCIAAAALAASAPLGQRAGRALAEEANLLCNGAFDSWTFTGPECWSVHPFGAASPVTVDGNQAARLAVDTSQATLLSQIVDLTSGPGTYRLQLRVRTQEPVNTIVQFRADIVTPGGYDPGLPVTVYAGPAWSSSSLDVEASDTEVTHVTVVIHTDVATQPLGLLVDDVRLTLVAPPTPTPPTPPPPTPIPPRLSNGSFEAASDGVLSAWKGYGGAVTQSSRHRADGAYSAAFTSSTDSTKWVYQVVAVRGGVPYDFSAYAHAPHPGVDAAFLRISWYQSDDGSGRALDSVDSLERVRSPTSGFVRLSTGPVMAPESAVSARLRLMLTPRPATSTTVYFDAATFGEAEAPPYTTPQPTPLPATRRSEVAGITGRTGPVDPLTLAPSDQGVKINEVCFRPEAPDDERAHEWVELYNPGPEPVNLAGWTLADNHGRSPVPQAVIPPGGFLVLAASDRVRDLYPEAPAGAIVSLNGTIGNGLANTGDRVILIDAQSRLVDAMSYGRDTGLFPVPPEAPARGTLERRPFGSDSDEAEDWTPNLRPTPGFGLTAQPRAVESLGAGAHGDIPGIVGYRLPEDNDAPPFVGYLVGVAVLSPVLTLLLTRISHFRS